MKKILAAVVLSLPLFANAAEAVVIAFTPNNAGGMNYLIGNADQCSLTSVGFVSQRPYQEPLRGCVTKTDDKSFHVFFENNLEMDFPYSGWTKPETKKSVKGGV